MSTLATDLMSLLKDGFCHDLTLVCEDGNLIKVHRNIMGARSVVFRTMLEVDMKENRTGIIEIKDFGPDVVSEFVNFLYSESFSKDFTNFVELLKMGHQYQVSGLVQECLQSLVKQEVNEDNVINLVTLVEEFQILGLSGKCAQLLYELSDKCYESLGENMEVLDPNEVDSLPSSLIRKSHTAYKMKIHLKYNARISHQLFKENGAQGSFIYTKFKVNLALAVSGVGLYVKEANVVDVELIHSDGSLITSTRNNTVPPHRFPSMVKIMFQLPGNVEPGIDYTVRVKFEKDFTFFKAGKIMSDIKVDTGRKSIKLFIVNDIADIPMLYFKESC